MKLSVIIPVYRTEATLGRCLQSVVSQPLTDMEVLLIDDGSPDNCPQLCDEWAQRDARIQVIHKENGGLSDARNAGLELAEGEYVTFIDSDDYLDENTLPTIMEAIGDSDLLEYPALLHDGSPKPEMLMLTDRIFSSPTDYWLEGQAYLHTYAWNKIYRRSLFRSVRFPVGRIFEDAYTLPRLLHQQPRIATTTRGLYHYTHNPMGITATAQGPQLAQLLDAHLSSGMPMDDCYYMHLLNIQMDVCELTGQPPRLPFRHVKLMSQHLKSKQRLKAFAQNLLGINKICSISKTIHQLRR